MDNRDIIRTNNVLVRIMKLEKGSSTEWHHHTEVTDFFVGLQGLVRVEARNPDEAVTLHPGQRSEIAHHHIHRVVNAYDGTSEYLLAQGIGQYDFIKSP